MLFFTQKEVVVISRDQISREDMPLKPCTRLHLQREVDNNKHRQASRSFCGYVRCLSYPSIVSITSPHLGTRVSGGAQHHEPAQIWVSEGLCQVKQNDTLTVSTLEMSAPHPCDDICVSDRVTEYGKFVSHSHFLLP